jgi:hypothetical protein
VWGHGFRWRKDKLFARPVFRCEHAICNESCRSDCTGIHYFTEPKQSRTPVHPLGLRCPECSVERTMHDGVPIANEWDFEAGLIADALIEVGSGASFRQAAQAMRVAARRFETVNGVPVVSLFGGSVMRYLDHFGTLIQEHVEHREWPEVLVLDALPLRQRVVRDDDPFSVEQAGSGAILVAVGYTDPVAHHRRRTRDDDDALVEQKPRTRRVPHVWKIAIAGGYNRWAWRDFLASLSGKPKWIVADGESAVRLGVKLRWGDGPDAPIVYSCEGHLQRKFRDRALTEDKLPPVEVWRLWPEYKRGVPAEDQPRGPLWTRDDYRRLLDAVLAFPEDRVANISSWLRYHDEVIRRQFALRDEFPGFTRGNGAVEAVIDQLRDLLGERTKVIQNVYRTNLMLGLIHAHLGHHDDRDLYVRIIRDELARTNGRPRINWREHHFQGRVRRGRAAPEGSLFHLADAYQLMGERAQRVLWVNSQAGSMEKKLLEHNLHHFLNGYPLLHLTDSPTPSVAVGGLPLRDFPLIRREWDPANSLDPDAISASYNKTVSWVCFENPSHRFPASVNTRCTRLTGCQECQKVRGAAAQQRAELTPRQHLLQIREAWGDYEDQPKPAVAVSVPAILTDEPDEDF